MSDPLELPFDVYQRYRLVADLLARLRAAAARRDGDPKRRLRVLDVGGRTAVLRGFDAAVIASFESGVAARVAHEEVAVAEQESLACALEELEGLPLRCRPLERVQGLDGEAPVAVGGDALAEGPPRTRGARELQPADPGVRHGEPRIATQEARALRRGAGPR